LRLVGLKMFRLCVFGTMAMTRYSHPKFLTVITVLCVVFIVNKLFHVIPTGHDGATSATRPVNFHIAHNTDSQNDSGTAIGTSGADDAVIRILGWTKMIGRYLSWFPPRDAFARCNR